MSVRTNRSDSEYVARFVEIIKTMFHSKVDIQVNT